MSVGPYFLAIVAAIAVNYALAWLIARLNATTAVAGLKVALLLLVRVSFRRILDHRRVLRFRNESSGRLF